MQFINPSEWVRPSGFSNGVLAVGRLLFIAGQIGWAAQQRSVSDDFGEQAARALQNIAAVLGAAGAQPSHVVRMTWYVTNKHAYLNAEEVVGQSYRAVFGKHYPAMTLVEVADLLEEGALVEIEATAVVPGGA